MGRRLEAERYLADKYGVGRPRPPADATRCNCENGACEAAGRHVAGACGEVARRGHNRVDTLGATCPGCYEKYPHKYRLPGPTWRGGPRARRR